MRRVSSQAGTARVATPASNLLSTSSGCIQGFSPAFTAGTADKQAGAYSPFTLTIGREDGSQRLGLINVTTPPGFSGNIAGVTICPNSDLEAAERRDRPGGGALEQAEPSCPAGSDVGTVTATAGAGPDSISTTGHEYLAGPYKGAPFDLVAITPAISGPFDLGVVVLRQGLYIDPHTGQATVKSDPMPTALDGVPLDIRSVTVHITGVGANNQFIFNPTSCAPLAIAGSLISTSWHERGDLEPISGHQLRQPEVQTGVRRLHGRDLQQSWRREPARRPHVPQRAAGHLREHQVGQGRLAQAAPRPPYDAAESLSGRDVRSKPGELSRRRLWSAASRRSRRS